MAECYLSTQANPYLKMAVDCRPSTVDQTTPSFKTT